MWNLRRIVTKLLPSGERLGTGFVTTTTSPKILIVEDEADLVRTLEYNFRQAGFTVLTATRGRDALQMATNQTPDLVLLDLMLPDIEGTEVCRRLRAEPKTKAIPIMMLTAKG